MERWHDELACATMHHACNVNCHGIGGGKESLCFDRRIVTVVSCACCMRSCCWQMSFDCLTPKCGCGNTYSKSSRASNLRCISIHDMPGCPAIHGMLGCPLRCPLIRCPLTTVARERDTCRALLVSRGPWRVEHGVPESMCLWSCTCLCRMCSCKAGISCWCSPSRSSLDKSKCNACTRLHRSGS